MEKTSYTFTNGISYSLIVSASERVTWTVDAVFSDRRFDATKPIIPDSWVGGNVLPFLDTAQRLTLNHIRAFSYLHLFGGYEEFIPIHLSEVASQDWHTDRTHLRALMRFGEEELKHQQLFLRAEQALEASCNCQFGRYFEPGNGRLEAFTTAFLKHPRLSRFLLLTAFEWGSQRHYVESLRDRGDAGSDPSYVDILKYHWIEESQHTKTDLLEIASLVNQASSEELLHAFEQIQSLGALVDETLVGQVDIEISTLQRLCGSHWTSNQLNTLRESIYKSMQFIWMEMALTHPLYKKLAFELSPHGTALLGIEQIQ